MDQMFERIDAVCWLKRNLALKNKKDNLAGS